MKRTRLGVMCVAGLAALLAGCTQPGGKAFDTPEAAADALAAAMKSQDNAKVIEVLGPESEEIVSSGDPVADREMFERFVGAYTAKHSFEQDESSATLIVGNEEWPMPVPLVRTGSAWRFDGKAGKEEVLSRRIGRNELATIEVCRAAVDAQREYAAGGFDGGAYARKLHSDPGTKNGLYWDTAPGEALSPMGAMVAMAESQGYLANPNRAPGGASRPFHGYCYRPLMAQGPNAKGGAMSYEVNGKLTRGFAVVAFPVEYRNSGVMTFMVNQDGLVYEKDLGPDSERIVMEMKSFDPGEGWDVVK